MKISRLLLATLLAAIASPVSAEEAAPPADGKSVCEIVQAVESEGFSQISEVIFEGRSWKVEAYKEGERRILRVDPETGAIQGEEADDDD